MSTLSKALAIEAAFDAQELGRGVPELIADRSRSNRVLISEQVDLQELKASLQSIRYPPMAPLTPAATFAIILQFEAKPLIGPSAPD